MLRLRQLVIDWWWDHNWQLCRTRLRPRARHTCVTIWNIQLSQTHVHVTIWNIHPFPPEPDWFWLIRYQMKKSAPIGPPLFMFDPNACVESLLQCSCWEKLHTHSQLFTDSSVLTDTRLLTVARLLTFARQLTIARLLTHSFWRYWLSADASKCSICSHGSEHLEL